MPAEPADEPLCDPLQVFLRALENTKPRLKLVPIIRGGITYQVREDASQE